MLRRIAVVAVIAAVVAACATSPLGRRQLQLFPDGQMQQMGVNAFQELKSKQKAVGDDAVTRYVRCVADAIVEVVPRKYAVDGGWEVQVFEDDTANAFALPGGKIGVHTGLLEVAENPAQLAAVIGHEVAHVMADHGNERMSQQFAASAGLAVAQAIAGANSPEKRQALSLLGLGAQVGVLLPYSRLHESEADLIGLDLMANAGFDPGESVELWRNMAKDSSGKAPPEFLSTHPSHGTRIQDLEAHLPEATKLYRQARQQGRRPQCRAVSP
ncbi:M48 family metallopeptidase [Arhodomonas sp. AD133]|uniref:M48 family metallopeptidase n=1 Tax=Arhodomonas sp. AD133 TaxID=3415009 RepID=UPI003EBFA486